MLMGVLMMAGRIYKYKRDRVKSVTSLNYSKFYNNEQLRMRYKLTIMLNKKDGNLTANFILMNPAEADCMKSDNTVTKIINYIFENKSKNKLLENTSKVVITNLYAIYAEDEEHLEQHIQKLGSKFTEGNCEGFINDDTIYKSIEESQYLVVAWGSGEKVSNYDNRIKEVENIINKLDKKDIYHVGKLIDGKYPKHLSRFSYEEKLNKYEL